MKHPATLTCAIALALFSTASHAYLDNGVAAGDVTQTTAVLWAHSTLKDADGTVPVVFKYGTDPSFALVDGTQTVVQNNYAEPAKLGLNGLQPGTAYYYLAEDAKGNAATGKFKTLPASNANPALRFSVLSGMTATTMLFPTNIPGLDSDVIVASALFAQSAFLDVSTYLQYHNLAGLQQDINRVLESKDGVQNSLAKIRGAAAFYQGFTGTDIGLPFSVAGGAPPSIRTDVFDQTGHYINETKRYKDGILAFQRHTPLAASTYGETGDARTANKAKFYRRMDYGKTATVILLDANSFRDKPVAAPADPGDAAQVQQFLIDAYAPSRTLLGAQQLADLKADLLAAEQNGIRWKFVHGAPTLQNIGPFGSSTLRYEGYAAERNDLLAYIKTHAIKNVVFVSNSHEGVWVNNLTYQDTLGGPQKTLDSFEVNIGQAATDKQFTDSLQRKYTPGNEMVEIAQKAGLASAGQVAFYDALPDVPDTDSDLNDKDDFIKFSVNNALLAPLGYDPLGLDGSSVNATLLVGDYVNFQKNTWAVFDINPKNKVLTVTLYGTDSIAGLSLDDPKASKSLPISVVSKFRAMPK